MLVDNTDLESKLPTNEATAQAHCYILDMHDYISSGSKAKFDGYMEKMNQMLEE